MKKLTFKKLYLLSKKAKRAKVLEFDPSVNVITGDNDTGKSSVLKAIYHTFGASPIHKPTNWSETAEITAVEFSLDNSIYTLLRHANAFALFDENKKLVSKYEGVGRENGIGTLLSKLLGFDIQMYDKNDNLRVLTPAYYFLPFYIDQDSGWSKIWESFEGLQQFSDYKTSMINYHTGIHPKRYFEIKRRIDQINQELTPLDVERNAVLEAEKRFKTHDGGFDIDLEEFKKEAQSLVVACNTLREKEDKYKDNLSTLEKQRFMLMRQAEIAENARGELEKDHAYVLEQSSKGHVECPTCGTEFENAISKRFRLVEDIELCHSLVLDLTAQEKQITEKIADLTRECSQNQQELKELQSLLEVKKGAISLKDIIGSESKKGVRRLLQEDIERTTRKIEKLNLELAGLKKEKVKIQDKKRIQEICAAYSEKMREYLHALDVLTVPPAQYEKPTSQIKNAGSDLPRAMLARYYGLLHIMEQFSPDYVACPIIVDSPLQQDPDDKNIEKILQFSVDKKPTNPQLILGTVDTHGLKYSGKTIQLTNKHRVLSDEDFKTVNPLLTELLDKTLMA